MITPADLDCFDRCPRRYAFERDWQPKFITPTGFLHATLEAALSSDDPEQAARDKALDIAQNREIDTAANRFMLVRHTGYRAGILGVALKGHDLVFPVSYLSEDTLRTLAHSWRVLGALLERKDRVRVTAVAVGVFRDGRRHSAWTRGYAHPVSHQLRFRKKKGEFKDWPEVWRDQSLTPTEDWIRQMKADDVMEELVASTVILYDPKDARIQQAICDSEVLRESMNTIEQTHPMRRSSCDDPIRGACPFQACCWSSKPTSLADFPHLYQDKQPAEPEAHTPTENTASSSRPAPVFRKGPGLLAQ
jgi:hypothetical protein